MMSRSRRRAQIENGIETELNEEPMVQTQRRRPYRQKVCHVSLPGVEKKVSLRRSQIDNCFHCPRCGIPFDDAKLIQDHTLRRCISRGRIRSLKFKIPAQNRDGNTGDVQYLFTRSRSFDIDEAETAAVAVKLEADDDASMGGAETPHAGSSSGETQSQGAVTSRVPPSPTEGGTGYQWELLYPTDDSANSEQTLHSSATSSQSSQRSAPRPISFRELSLDAMDLDTESDPLPDADPPTLSHSNPSSIKAYNESPSHSTVATPRNRNLLLLPPTQFASPTIPGTSPLGVSQQPSPPRSISPLSPREGSGIPITGPPDPNKQPRPTILSQSLLASPLLRSSSSSSASQLPPTPNPNNDRAETPNDNTTALVNSISLVTSSLPPPSPSIQPPPPPGTQFPATGNGTIIPPPLFSFLSSLNEPLFHLADIFIDLGFTTDYRLDILCRKSKFLKIIEGKIEERGTLADWAVVEEGLEERARRLAS